MTDSIDVLCGKCKVPLVVIDNPKPHDMVTCPKCGASDRYDKIMDEATHQMVGVAEDSFADVFKGKEGWDFTKK